MSHPARMRTTDMGANAGIQGRCAALSRSVPWNDWLGSVVDKATQNKCIKLLTIV